MSIYEYCKQDTAVLLREDSVLDAARTMRDQHIGCIVVVDTLDAGRNPVGILTDRDIVVAVTALNLDAEEIAIGDVMSSEVQSVGGHESSAVALETMQAAGVRRLPVVDADGALVGIVSSDDLLGVLAEQLANVARLVSREQRRERETRRVKV